MKTGEDFRREFPETEEGFKDSMYTALQSVHGEKRRAHMNLKPIVAFGLILLLMMSVGIAASVEKWSLFDSVPDTWVTANEAEQAQMKDSFEPVCIDGRVADATVREAIYDGFGLYLVIDLRPTDPTVFLMPDMNANLTDPAQSVVSSFPEDVTLEEHIKTLGYKTVYRVDVMTLLPGMVFPATMDMNEDGSFSFFLRQRMTDDQNMMLPEIACEMMVHIKRNSTEQVTNGSTILEYLTTELNIEAQPMLGVKSSIEGDSHVFENCGVRVSDVRLYKTLLTTYLTADVEIVDQEKYDDHYQKYLFYASDQKGNRLNSGYFNVSGVSEDSSTGEYYYACTLALDELPDELSMTEVTWKDRENNILDSYTFQLEDIQ